MTKNPIHLMTKNPIYRHLTAHSSKWPSRRAATRLSVIACLAQVLLVSIPLGPLVPAPEMKLYFLLLIAIIPALAIPCLAAIGATILARRDTEQESFSLLRITALPADEIVDGMVNAAEHRLRLLEIIAIGLVPVTSIILVMSTIGIWVIATIAFRMSQLQVLTVLTALIASVLLAVGGIYALASHHFYLNAITLGVWAEYRWRQYAPVVVIGGVCVIGALVWLGLQLLWMSRPVIPLLLLGGCFALYGSAMRYVRHDAIRAIERM